MDFLLNEEQEMLKKAARDFLERECPESLIREIEAPQELVPQIQTFIRSERDTKKHLQKFICLLKGSLYANSPSGKFVIRYAHSLQIEYRSRL